MDPQVTSIPFSSSTKLQPFKLLEVPPALLTLLEDAKVRPSSLQLVTSPTSSQALLKTPNATYELLQKHTSNPIMVLAPSTTAGSEAAGISGVNIVGRCDDTIELVEVNETQHKEGREGSKKRGKWHEKFARK